MPPRPLPHRAARIAARPVVAVVVAGIAGVATQDHQTARITAVRAVLRADIIVVRADQVVIIVAVHQGVRGIPHQADITVAPLGILRAVIPAGAVVTTPAVVARLGVVTATQAVAIRVARLVVMGVRTPLTEAQVVGIVHQVAVGIQAVAVVVIIVVPRMVAAPQKALVVARQGVAKVALVAVRQVLAAPPHRKHSI